MNGIERLLRLRAENDEAREVMQLSAPRFDRIAQRHLNGTAPKAVTGFNLFQTPRNVAERMAEIVRGHVGPGARILEPSAGLGRLYEPLKELQAEWEMVEEAAEVFHALKKAFDRARRADFLSLSAGDLGGKFDAVIMNPPFKQGTDIKHIDHAREMLAPGGVLVSLCYDGARQNAHLKPRCDSWEVLPGGTFREEGTGASVAMLTITN